MRLVLTTLSTAEIEYLTADSSMAIFGCVYSRANLKESLETEKMVFYAQQQGIEHVLVVS
uniref:Uncharacterized protein n=1 Tax=Ciona intestinalis TaxID=7719 RepID=H2XZZ7_CIOIN